jgi:uncharacterized FAD-dependent dehydrogenase
MLRLSEIKLPLEHAESALDTAVADRLARLGVPADGLVRYTVFRRAHDARKRDDIKLTYIVDVEVRDEAAALKRIGSVPHCGVTPDMAYRFVTQAPAALTADASTGASTHRAGVRAIQRPVVIGMGPCGLFAALILAQMGFRPIILERGKAVRERTKDTFGLWRKSVLNPESNVQFGEGGAGTFSDGKLYSQIKDPKHYGRKVLEEFVKAGAPEDILYLSRPHIGTFRLVSMVEKMRATIHALGGEVRFETRVEDFDIDQGKLRGLMLAGGEYLACDHVVLAIGHSARDTFEQLHQRGVYVEAKPFSLGFRIEHPQGLIDRSRFGKFAGHKTLGAADYKVVHHCSNGRTVYSFCMCPGGTVVAATSEPGRVVTNASTLGPNATRTPASWSASRPPTIRTARSRASPSSANGKRARSSSAAATTARPASASPTLSRAARRPRSAASCPRTSPA